MSKAALSEFLQASAKHLGLDIEHGDTETTHPYVCRTLNAEQIIVPAKAAVEVAPIMSPAPVAVTPVEAPAVHTCYTRHPVTAPMSTGAAITMRYQAVRDAAMRKAAPGQAPQ